MATIVEALKKLIVKRGGSTSGVHTISDAVEALNKAEEESEDEDNPDTQQEVG